MKGRRLSLYLAKAVVPAARVPADGATLFVGAMLVTVTVAAWASVLAQAGPGGGMAMDDTSPRFGPTLAGGVWFVGAWVVMMAAMMLPSAAPLVLLYRVAGRGGRAANTLPLVAGYLSAWVPLGALVYVAQQGLAAAAQSSPALGRSLPYGVAAVLALAGLYQFTPLKAACLRQCRSPLNFLMQRWRGGAAHALRLGAEHGAYCVGCCWALMAVLVAAGAMNLAWVTVIALVVFVEKLLPFGRRAAKVTGTVLVALAVLVAARPEVSMVLRGSSTGM